MVGNRSCRIAASAGLFVVLAGTAGCGDEPATQIAAGSGTTTTSGAHWQRLPDAPLSPRASSVMVSSGTEVLVIGGQDTAPCPPGADCAPGRITRDGAALDLTTRTWRTIAPAPRPLLGEQAVVIDGVVHVLAQNHGPDGYDKPARLLSYDVATDQWREAAAPANSIGAALTSSGAKLLAYETSHEQGLVPDRILDGGTWRDLPRDPLAPSFDRVMVAVGDERLILFAHELVTNPGADKPSIVQAAEYDLAKQTWRRLPDSEIIGGWYWSHTDGLLVDPSIGGADGGQTGNYGRVYPEGGIFDPRARQWRPLPALPAEPSDDLWQGPATGGPELAIVRGFVLDPGAGKDGRWIRLPQPVRGAAEDPAAAWVGDRLVAFGGTVHTDRKSAFTADTWMWQQ
ncbi:hypothetical protein ABN034_04600 [Actinopolymorpha sp. B11F2]|uniref:hypothetical protein n=1 Tax=Actinopolymorpha sp. B11F2 TaxID=3160862 RepID=UPI0032E3CD04